MRNLQILNLRGYAHQPVVRSTFGMRCSHETISPVLKSHHSLDQHTNLVCRPPRSAPLRIVRSGPRKPITGEIDTLAFIFVPWYHKYHASLVEDMISMKLSSNGDRCLEMSSMKRLCLQLGTLGERRKLPKS